MSTEKPTEVIDEKLSAESISIEDLTTLLVKHFGHKEGFYDLLVQFKIGTASFGPSKEDAMPSAIVSLAAVGLKQVEKPGPKSVNARDINPPRRAPKRSVNSSKS